MTDKEMEALVMAKLRAEGVDPSDRARALEVLGRTVAPTKCRAVYDRAMREGQENDQS